ncbi:hypothetical protein D3C85_940500 [compost metagenome]
MIVKPELGLMGNEIENVHGVVGRMATPIRVHHLHFGLRMMAITSSRPYPCNGGLAPVHAEQRLNVVSGMG